MEARICQDCQRHHRMPSHPLFSFFWLVFADHHINIYHHALESSQQYPPCSPVPCLPDTLSYTFIPCSMFPFYSLSSAPLPHVTLAALSRRSRCTGFSAILLLSSVSYRPEYEQIIRQPPGHAGNNASCPTIKYFSCTCASIYCFFSRLFDFFWLFN